MNFSLKNEVNLTDNSLTIPPFSSFHGISFCAARSEKESMGMVILGSMSMEVMKPLYTDMITIPATIHVATSIRLLVCSGSHLTAEYSEELQLMPKSFLRILGAKCLGLVAVTGLC